MKKGYKTTSPVKVANSDSKLNQFVYHFVVYFTLAIIGWAILLYLNEGIRLPVWALFGVFLCGIVVFILAYRHRYRKAINLLRVRFPQITFDKVLKACFVIAIIVGILARLGFAFIGKPYNPTEPLSDTGIHWEVSRELARGEPMQGDTAMYEAFFPHLMAYSVTLSLFMRIFGQNLFAILISNLLFDLVSMLCLYLLLRSWKSQRAAMIGSIIWLINPIEILYCGVGMSMIVTNTLVLSAILIAYYTYQFYQKENLRLFCLFACLFGLTVAVGNSFRPIFTVIAIAVVVIFLFNVLSKFKQGFQKTVPTIIGLVIMFFSSFAGAKLIDFSYQHLNSYHVPGGTGVGWNFMLGANYESWGRWNRADSARFGELVYGNDVNPNLVEIQSTFFKEGINRYLAMNPLQFIIHFLHKTQVFLIDQNNTIAWPFGEAYNVGTDHVLYQLLHGLGVALFATLFCLAFFFLVSSLRANHSYDQTLFFLCLCFCGLVAASLLVEVMWRYVLQAMVVVIILAACGISKITARKETQS